MIWSILIATLSERQEKLCRLLDVLLPQAEAFPVVEVVALHNNGEYPLQDIRQALLDDARGEWVSFVDDDDMVAPDFVPAVVRCLAQDPDFVAFRMALYWGGYRDARETVTGLGLGGWLDTPEHYYRDVTHVNPARTSLARQAGFTRLADGFEDRGYVAALRPLLKTQAEVGRVLYHYYQSGVNPLAYRPSGPVRPRPEIASPAFRWHPMSTG